MEDYILEKGRNQPLMAGLKIIQDFYKKDTRCLIAHLYQEGFTVQAIGELMGKTKQQINEQYGTQEEILTEFGRTE